MAEFVRKIRVQRPAEEVFAWHERPGAFQRLSPPWVAVSVEKAEGGIRDGGEVWLTQKIGPFSSRWHLRHEGYVEGRAFADRQVSGPFMQWLHHHRFEPAGDGACDLVDEISYELPMQTLAQRIVGRRVHRELERVFRYRHDVTKMDLETHPLPKASRPLTVAITGATGLVGSALAPLLRTSGHKVRTISRGGSGDVRWDPSAGKLDLADLDGVDAFVHLAGEPIAQRWTDRAREKILKSRREGTRLLAQAASRLDPAPQAFLSMSGVNAYGFQREAPVSEGDPLGDGFLAEVCREWESAADDVVASGVRTVIVRSGMVLSPAGGALAKLLPIFRAGVGGPVGDGSRWMSWIAIDYLAAILAHAILDERYRGVVNAVAPRAVTNREFSKTLGACLHRPAIIPAPPGALKLAFGQMAEETVLSDLRVEPGALAKLGYRYRLPELRRTFEHLLGREADGADQLGGEHG